MNSICAEIAHVNSKLIPAYLSCIQLLEILIILFHNIFNSLFVYNLHSYCFKIRVSVLERDECNLKLLKSLKNAEDGFTDSDCFLSKAGFPLGDFYHTKLFFLLFYELEAGTN